MWIAHFGGHRSKGRTAPWWQLAGFSIVAAAIVGALCGALLGFFGGLVPLDTRVGAGAFLATLLVVVSLAPRLEPIQLRRETGQQLVALHPLLWAVVNGSLLGLGVSSRVAFWIWYLVPVGCFVLGSPLAGAVIWGIYGLTRLGTSTIVAWTMHRDPSRMIDIMDHLLATRPQAETLSRTALAILALALSLLLGL